ncbi:hypothetical protein PR048_015832 [Dryococelus australis]|uniref:Uncharacterized protein n=1 Tax=Dryococelus australis TaxID=614101 RepID=A0ABQ9HI18_9NEOP|nr:hypothetical protein PR048_015832 [Dryococelus australis]
MVFETRGAVNQIRKESQNAIIRPCYNHALNLSFQCVGLCETRWVDCHDSVLQLCTALPKIAAALEFASKWKDSASSSKAISLLCAISESDFIVAVVSLYDLRITTLQLSRTLQKKKTLDLKKAEEMLRNTITTLKAKRGKCEQEFLRLFSEARDIALELGTELKVQRIAKKQVHRCNTSAPDLEVFFR